MFSCECKWLLIIKMLSEKKNFGRPQLFNMQTEQHSRGSVFYPELTEHKIPEWLNLKADNANTRKVVGHWELSVW